MSQPVTEEAQLQQEFKAMVKNFVGDGAQTQDLMLPAGEQQFWQRFSGFLGAHV